MARLVYSAALGIMMTLLLASICYTQTVPADHECVRECKWPPEPKTCRYVFTMEWRLAMWPAACFDCPFNITDCDRPGCIPVNGVERPIFVVNRQLPGPPIQVCEDDTVEVKVWNRLGNSDGTSVHWHAIHQRGTPYMDGPAMITQCPISPQSSFTYNFKAYPGGTHYWHSHSNLQRIDGGFGAFIVNQAPDRDPNSDLYDFDLPEHVVIVQAWPDLPATPFGETPGQIPAPTINAKGQFKQFVKGNDTAYTPREVFQVKQGQRYRFRVIGNNNCHMYVSVDGHNLTAIATDGAPIKPVSVDRIGVASGERYDFVLTADQDVGNYWFRVQVHEGVFTAEMGLRKNLQFCAMKMHRKKIHRKYLKMVTMTFPDDERLLNEPDKRFYLELGWTEASPQHFNSQDYPHPPESEPGQYTTHMNYVSFKIPPSPLLSQYGDIPKKDFCYIDEYPAGREKCTREYCSCTQILKLELGQVVELVLVSEGSEHPMHIHGYSFRVVGSGGLPDRVTVEDVIEMDKQGDITRKLEGAVLKDNVPMENGGYYIVRFVADNPGKWLFHCHDIFHHDYGMQIVIQVGEESDLPPIPADFPRCGSWSKPADENKEASKKERKPNGEHNEPAKKGRKQPSAE
ncbi:uncharacterized protein [Amphiura filiformis]|uniref:uncharacterized protein n=1 Tax=Amphiura filiformis TaxID=82378 RepID=UPI003B22712A